MTYTCKICSTTSDVSDFYKGVTSRCKECHKAKVRENRAARAEYYKEYDAKRFQNDPKVRERHRRYQKTPKGKKAMQAARQKWLATNPEKGAAHVILRNRIRSGEIERPTKCAECGAGGRIEGHHEDYSRPLDVLWLCRQCHMGKHK